MKPYQTERQLGVAKFKTILTIFVVGFSLVIVLVLATTSPKPGSNAQQSGNTGSQNDDTQSTDADRAVKLPDGFSRFTSKQHKFSVAVPEVWGGLLASNTSTSANANDPSLVLRASTKEFISPVGDAQLNGVFNVTIYQKDDFEIEAGSGSPVLKPVVKDSKTTWQVASTAPDDTKSRIGNTYKVASSVNPSNLTIYDFTLARESYIQSRWVFKSNDNYVIMSLPQLTRTDQAPPTAADIAFYKTFTESIIDTVSLPK